MNDQNDPHAAAPASTAPDSFIGGDSEMAVAIRAHNWADTPLGPISTWSQALRTTVSLCLASNFPINIIWGDSHTQIYNDGYRVVCGDKHPASLGMDYRECWASAWPAIGQPFHQALQGTTSFLENVRMFLFRSNYLEETFFTFSLSPIRDETGGIGGLFHPVTETTATMLGERRTRIVRDLTARLNEANSVTEVYNMLDATLAQFALDLPFVLVYARAGNGQADAGAGSYRLACATGIATGTVISPAVTAFDDGALWPADLLQGGRMVERHGVRALLGETPCGPYEEAPDTAFAVPIGESTAGYPGAVLVAGASSRLSLTDAYRGLYDLIAAALAAALARVRMAEEDRRRMEMLAAIDRAKTVFFSNTSHEFRTPLTLMLGPLQDALDAELAPVQRQRIEVANRNAQRLLKLVNSLLDFSRIEAGRTNASFSATDLAALTAELASIFRSACEQAGLTLNVTCAPLPQPVFVDRTMWEKIVLNLLSNAFKYTLQGEISVALHAGAEGALLTVSDTGVGIPPDHLERVFDRFHRIEGQRGRSVEGTGIGLTLVRELVLLHGGSIGVTSSATGAAGRMNGAGGSTFTVQIPWGQAHLQPDQIVAPDEADAPPLRDDAEVLRWLPANESVPAHHAAASAAPAAAAPDAPYIVLADDNADMRGYVQRLLAERGYRVAAFDDGAAALAHIRAGELPDLVLSDVMMAQLDGFALLHALRSDQRTRSVVVILLSARAGEEARLEGLHAGADDYMVKPFSARELSARVDGAIALMRQRRSAAEREHALLRQIDEERSRSALSASEAHITSFFEQSAAGVAEADADGILVRVNPHFAGMLGRTVESIVGMRLDSMIHPDDLAHNAQLLGRMFATGESFNIENRYLHADGHEIWVSKAVTGICPTPGGLPTSAVAVVLDITQRRHTESELRDTSRRKDEFLAMLAHELRNPLAPISAAAQLMAIAHGDPGRVKQTSEVIMRQVSHMTALVDDLLDVSRVTRGLVTVERSPQQVKSVVAHAVEQARPMLQARRHRLILDMAPEHDYVLGDRKRLVQIVTNLLNNAAKYTPEGGTVHVRSEVEAGQVGLFIRDNGIGIDPSLQGRIFDLFAQAERTPDRSQGGLGLGLALVRSLVDLHGGSVTCHSDGIGKGACFAVHLPLLALNDDVGDELIEPANRVDAQAPLKIMVVDDNVDAAKMLSMVLQALGHDVVIAHRSPVALQIALREQPDVCILDIGLPEMDGNELARRLRASANTAHAKLIAVTGYSQESNRVEAMQAGFDRYLVKPVEMARLTAALYEVSAQVERRSPR